MFQGQSTTYCPNLFFVQTNACVDFKLPVYITLKNFVREYATPKSTMQCTIFCPIIAMSKPTLIEFYGKLKENLYSTNVQFNLECYCFISQQIESLTNIIQGHNKSFPTLRIVLVKTEQDFKTVMTTPVISEYIMKGRGYSYHNPLEYTVAVPKHVLISGNTIRKLFDNLTLIESASYDPTYFFMSDPHKNTMLDLENFYHTMKTLSCSNEALITDAKYHVVTMRNGGCDPRLLLPLYWTKRNENLISNKKEPKFMQYDHNKIEITSYKFCHPVVNRKKFVSQVKLKRQLDISALWYILRVLLYFLLTLLLFGMIIQTPLEFSKIVLMLVLYNMFNYFMLRGTKNIVNFFNDGRKVFYSNTPGPIYSKELIYSENRKLQFIIVSHGYIFMTHYIIGGFFFNPILQLILHMLYFCELLKIRNVNPRSSFRKDEKRQDFTFD